MKPIALTLYWVAVIGIIGASVIWTIADAHTGRWSTHGLPEFAGQGMVPFGSDQLTKATAEMNRRYSNVNSCRRCASLIRWGGLFSTGIVLAISAWATSPKRTTQPQSPDSSTTSAQQIPPIDGQAIMAAVERALGDHQRYSQVLVRMVALLIALNSFSILVSQRLDSDADQQLILAKDLDNGITEATGVLYDASADEKTKAVELHKLESLMARSW